MQGKLDGTALRVPVPTGSLTDFTAVVDGEPSIEDVNGAFAAAASSGRLAPVLDYTEEPIVSSDIVTSPASCTLDAGLTMTQGSLVKIAGWYDNEWGYSNRLVDLSVIVGAANGS
jgi:glyceraldehyde 3-phosphate dehydrogenase